jgi:hypothetical protein
MTNHFLAAGLVLGFPALVAAAEGAPKPSDLKEINIMGESRIQMRGDKPNDVPKLNPQEPLESYLTEKINLASPGDRLVTNPPILLPPKTASDIVLSPLSRHLWSPPVLYLSVKNSMKGTVDHWHLTVTDDHGQIFRTYKGKGRLPDHLEWDGLGDDGTPLRVGHSYSCALSVLDSYGVPSYLARNTVRLGSYVDDRRSKVTVILDTPSLFVPGPNLSQGGTLRLQEARDWLRKHYRSIRVDVYGTDQDLSQRQADVIRKFLETALHLNDGNIPARGHVAAKDDYVRTEILAK